MNSRLQRALSVFTERLRVRRETAPIAEPDELARFVATRAAFVAQKTLYGYLKTRMGTRYPSLFEDDVFVRSINIAKHRIYAACLSDLAVFAAAHAYRERPSEEDARRHLAVRCFTRGLDDNAADAPEEFPRSEVVEEMLARCAATDWTGAALGGEAFSESPRALFRWAPIAPELKRFDTDVIANSITFAWHEVRRDLLRRLDADGIAGPAD